jgi:CheY-like chemotaxis protein
MRIPDLAGNTTATGARLLVADDDEDVRRLFATLLRATAGVASVLEAKDGAEAVDLGRERQLDVAVLDLNMPRLDGVAAAVKLRALRPSLKIALYSSDAELLRQRAAGLELPLFDKFDLDRLLEWVERQATDASAVCDDDRQAASEALRGDLCCSECGYGIVSRTLPTRCPMCGVAASWTGSSSRRPRSASGVAA